ncbi:MAG: peroxiredoxin [Betaproteobacteria bacterium]|nr:MAG: peroxiredoxin [Betaproteobacteria bacterium]
MAETLMSVMVDTGPKNATELGAPFFQATVATAIEFDVEVILTARVRELAEKGVAEKLYVKEGPPKSAHDFIRDAHEAEVHFKVRTPALERWWNDLIPEIEETIGGAYVIQQAMDERLVSFTH